VRILVLTEEEIRGLITMPDALEAVRKGFVSLAEGQACLPDVINLDIPEVSGEIHVKGAYLKGAKHAVFKIATGFYGNPALGLPSSSGLMLALNASTGAPSAMLLDNGYLTEMRTGAAGALAADLLAHAQLSRVAMIGTGTQARFQMRGLSCVRHIPSVAVWGRSTRGADVYAREMIDELSVPFEVYRSIDKAVRGADLVVTATPSHRPLLQESWIEPGAHITAVGSDGPEKQELAVAILSRADVLIADQLHQCAKLGEIHHAIDAGVLALDRVAGELGDLVCGRISGRRSPDDVTVCDLTGVGVQDAAIAELVLERALAEEAGTLLSE